ncbi:hypothetical protein HUG15_16245 [Salicibibacter cibarius]|uniref:Uncharacterized protein n=1 Tax=Salicibibacter cibarius TaxID=2743000 RepID=A0A7T7CCJ6_9BACI|nr:hypothetical protein HUG15_16245 [Salicibibacter cibarius]
MVTEKACIRKTSVVMAASWRPNERLAFVFGRHELFHGDRGACFARNHSVIDDSL